MADTTAPRVPAPPPQFTGEEAFSLFHPEPDEPDHWLWLEQHLGHEAIRDFLDPLKRVLKIAREHGCRTVVVEERYVDADYRSEYSTFWSRRFQERPPLARRVHFFGARLEVGELHDLPPEHDYIGYCVLRPTALGPMGRTVLRPPSGFAADAVLCTVVEHPSLFGCELEVEGVPFCQQDGELLRCAHAAAWLCHYIAQERHLISRHTTAEIAKLPSSDPSKYRSLPSNGLTAEQLQSIFSALGTPALFYAADDLPDPPAELPPIEPERVGVFGAQAARERAVERAQRQWKDEMDRERLLRVVCKYLNSGFPVVVLTEGEENHAFTLVGWERVDGRVRLLACDDQVGPYEPIDDVLEDQRAGGRWVSLMVPLPEKAFLTGEAAEQMAWNIAQGAANLTTSANAQEQDFVAFRHQLEHLRAGISVRTQLIRGREYKNRIGAQDRHPDALRLYRMAHLPNWVWLVEFHDPRAREGGQPCVLAEIVFDSTSHDVAPLTLLATTASTARDHGALRRGEAVHEAPGPRKPWTSLICPVAAQDEDANEQAA